MVSGTRANLSWDQRDHTLRDFSTTDPWPPPRISGDAAFDKDILGSVSEQIQKNFARTHWKVSVGRGLWTWLEAAPTPHPSGGWPGLPVASVVLKVLGPWPGHGLTTLSPHSEHSMLPPSCTTSASWGKAQRERRPQSGGWPATATLASGPASPPSGDAQVCECGPCTHWELTPE